MITLENLKFKVDDKVYFTNEFKNFYKNKYSILISNNVEYKIKQIEEREKFFIYKLNDFYGEIYIDKNNGYFNSTIDCIVFEKHLHPKFISKKKTYNFLPAFCRWLITYTSEEKSFYGVPLKILSIKHNIAEKRIIVGSKLGIKELTFDYDYDYRFNDNLWYKGSAIFFENKIQKKITTNGTCPICNKPAFLMFNSAECTNSLCENWKMK